VVNEAAEKYFVGNAQLLKKLETVSSALQNNAKIVVPANTDLVNIIGDLAGAPVPVQLNRNGNRNGVHETVG